MRRERRSNGTPAFDRKVRILLRLRKDAADLPVAPASQDQDDGVRMENIEGAPDNDIASDIPQGVEVVKDLKMNEQCGNIYENKGPLLEDGRRTGNVIENKCSYAQNAGMLLKTKGVTENAELLASSISSVDTVTVPREANGGEIC
jgi:hypothetical protein